MPRITEPLPLYDQLTIDKEWQQNLMLINISAFIILIFIYTNEARADDKKQNMVAVPKASSVFMPLQRYRPQKGLQNSNSIFFPLKSRARNSGIAKPLRPASMPRHFSGQVPQAEAPALPAPQISPGTQIPDMTPEQAQQILSIYGTQR